MSAVVVAYEGKKVTDRAIHSGVEASTTPGAAWLLVAALAIASCSSGGESESFGPGGAQPMTFNGEWTVLFSNAESNCVDSLDRVLVDAVDRRGTTWTVVESNGAIFITTEQGNVWTGPSSGSMASASQEDVSSTPECDTEAVGTLNVTLNSTGDSLSGRGTSRWKLTSKNGDRCVSEVDDPVYVCTVNFDITGTRR
jgi:hypothetical protein